MRCTLTAHFYTVFHRMCALRDENSAQTVKVWALLRHCAAKKNLQFLQLRLSLQE